MAVSAPAPGVGRSTVDAADAVREALVRAMERLLEIGGVRAASRFATVDGVRLHYLEAGSGSPLVLLHGAGGGAANWFRVMRRLSERHRVLALDLPGFGLSDPIRPRAPLGRQVADLVGGWCAVLGIDRLGLVGTSFGGLAALRYAQRSPAAIRSLVLVDSVGLGRALPWVVRLAGTPIVGPVLLRPTRAGTRWVLRRLMTADRRSMIGEVEDALVEYLRYSDLAGDLASRARAFRLFVAGRGQREVLSDAELAAVKPSALVVWGGRDRFLPLAHGERAAAAIPGARFQIIPGAGHSPNWESPDDLAEAVLSFLSNAESVTS